jgi:drug/metabolite transporter (DMT)-like permease
MVLPQIFMMGAAETYANMNLKKYAGDGSRRSLIHGLLAWVIVIFLLINSFKSHNLLHVSILWEFAITIFTALTAYFILGERFTSRWQWLGVVLVFVGAYLVHQTGDHIVV